MYESLQVRIKPKEYPITCILGERGDGKTLFMTALAESYHKEGIPIYANYHLYDIPYTYITFEQLQKDFKNLSNCVVLLDELQVGADSYSPKAKSNVAITTLCTQIRKRKIRLLYSTQNTKMINYRIRLQTNYIIYCKPTDVLGIIRLSVFKLPYNDFVKQFVKDCRHLFGRYDTDEMIDFNGF